VTDPAGRAAAAADDGSADPVLATALPTYETAPAPVWAALVGARVFLALEARPGAPDPPEGAGREATTMAADSPAGHDHDRGAEMVLLGLTRPSGTRALPAFLAGDDVPRWAPSARPLRLTGSEACRAALDDGADVLLLDPDGAAVPVPVHVLRELAAGRVPVAGAALSTRLSAGLPGAGAPAAAGGTAGSSGPGPAGHADPRLVGALGSALRPERAVRAARLVPGPDGPVLGLVLRSHLPAEQLLALADRVRARLGADLPRDGLDLMELDPDAATSAYGLEVDLGRRWWQQR
jgi:hypothetical protein